MIACRSPAVRLVSFLIYPSLAVLGLGTSCDYTKLDGSILYSTYNHHSYTTTASLEYGACSADNGRRPLRMSLTAEVCTPEASKSMLIIVLFGSGKGSRG
ncbi:hypothetical protein BGW36DRAFT_374647 [Talaromyces proteolyticus]|uniref:Secreted protein n=1 Tax=Talaromyces proteolyticus TaxID=1131652 RepID=A0AAD4KZG2_9EURO|nr:uncharacterized protein BGW36DRAFT_374647 [Talaromyces proteolyticus]KAH8700650.1 hypothetical protein BGW36DRAFT_374647 [Talaromyces proteolyticus]